MNKINYKESIDLNSKIDELLLINIDENLLTNSDDNFVNIEGEIKISGEVKTNNEQKSFTHSINVNISLSKEQLSREDINISIDDFNYTINNNLIEIDLYLKIDGLKEIDACFPSQEDKENVEIELDDDNVFDNKIDMEEQIEVKENIEKENDDINQESNFSLLNQIFRSRALKKERVYLIHVVKNETSYNEISQLYGIDENLIRSVNNDKPIENGKLIFIPSSK